MSKSLAIQKAISVIEQKGQAITTSRNVAENFKKDHKHVMEAIRNCEASETFVRSNFRLTEYLDSQNRKQPMYYMTKDGFAMLAFGFTGKEAAKFKEDYINQFNQMESLLRQKQTQQWQEIRVESKASDAILKDTIKSFIDYSFRQGSLHANKYYQHFEKLANKALDIKDGQRDYTDGNRLSAQTFIFNVINMTILEEMAKQTPYKEVYPKVKEKVEQFSQYFQPQLQQIAN